MKTNLNQKSVNPIDLISLGYALVLTSVLAIDYQLEYLPDGLKLVLGLCIAAVLLVSTIRISNYTNKRCNFIKMLIFYNISTLAITTVCLLNPDVHAALTFVLWVLLFLNSVIFVVLIVNQHKTKIEQQLRETDIIYPEHNTISRDYYGWVAISVTTLYLATANYFFDFMPEWMSGMIDTFCLMVSTTYFLNLKWGKKVLGIEEKVVKGNKYLSKKILPWMIVINIPLLIIGYVLIFFEHPNTFISAFYIISLIANVIFTIMIFLGKFKENDPLKEP